MLTLKGGVNCPIGDSSLGRSGWAHYLEWLRPAPLRTFSNDLHHRLSRRTFVAAGECAFPVVQGAARREPSAPPSLSPESPDSGSSDMAHVSSSRSPPSWPRSMLSPFHVHVVEKSMLPAMHYARMLCVCVVHAVGKAVRVARVTESQAERAAQARVRAARHIDLPLLLARAAEQGATAAGGDSMI